ncbi:HNH endonuclease [Burkholderia sp. BE12]|uniref:HNH endonuclease n=1 Tax=Burkholderia sp. BE12 TaxID=2082394 RepID=UPI000CF4975A|nr:HNH endonuclease [Burkholderia sp. BE12]
MKRIKYRTGLTAERLRELLHYDLSTGIFRWRKAARRGIAPGTVAGSLTNGYIEIGVDGESYRAHRLAWLYVHGVWPVDQLDHRDLMRSNNGINNLRTADNVQNNCNQKLRQTNTSGFKGVSYCKQTGRWVARIRYQGRKRHLGRFDAPAEAYEVYCLAADLTQGEFSNHD